MVYQNKQIPTNKNSPEEQCWKCQSCSAVSITLFRRAQLQASSSLPTFSQTEASWLQKFLPYILVDSQRWMPMVGMSEALHLFIVIRNNILDFCLSNISSSWDTQILYNQASIDQKF